MNFDLYHRCRHVQRTGLRWGSVWFSGVLQCVVQCVVRCVAECCIISQCVARFRYAHTSSWFILVFLCGVVRVAVGCSVLQCVAMCCSALKCVAVYCSVLQCMSVCYGRGWISLFSDVC